MTYDEQMNGYFAELCTIAHGWDSPETVIMVIARYLATASICMPPAHFEDALRRFGDRVAEDRVALLANARSMTIQ